MMEQKNLAAVLTHETELYEHILVALDSSDHANRGMAEAVALSVLCEGSITGTHIYAAKMHDMRFRQMEGGLPEQFREEQELERQREVHDDLITRGLSIITDSYLDQAEKTCASQGIEFARSSLEGKNYSALVNEVNNGGHDLLVMGALGLGAIAGNRLGTVCTRVVRRSNIDTLVIKDPLRPLAEGPIAVAVDGSTRSYGGLMTALWLARAWEVPLHVLAAFDPYYHYVAFNRIADVLSDEASKVFSFKDQEKLHEEIIDSGLAKIYEGHLAVAKSIAADYGQDVETVLLDGKPHDAIEKHLQILKPSLLVVGKLGIHADPELDIGGNAEALLRNVDCAVLLSQREHQPRIDVVADVTTSWTTEAEQRMQSVPSFAQSMVRLSILRFAQERGHTVVTASIVDEATAQLCPVHAREAMAEIVAAHDAGELGNTEDAMQEMVWADTALELLQSVPEPSLRDTVQRRAEKKALRDHKDIVEDEHISPFLSTPQPAPVSACPFAQTSQSDLTAEGERLTWESAAMQRLSRIPEGFMRTMTQRRVETFARRRGASIITPELLDEKYAEWAGGSAKQSAHLHWDDSAWDRIQKIPEVVRGMVIKEMENCAQQLGVDSVTTDVMAHASDAWLVKGVFHSEAAYKQTAEDGAREE
ncbi:MAG: universal stress protein [Proteobacteria bacterium]|nr:universal stress protein [Pseudomonadota bacterium]